MPTTAIEVLSVCDMACSLSWAPLPSFARWRGGSTAGPFHYRKSSGEGAAPSLLVGQGADRRSFLVLFCQPSLAEITGARPPLRPWRRAGRGDWVPQLGETIWV